MPKIKFVRIFDVLSDDTTVHAIHLEQGPEANYQLTSAITIFHGPWAQTAADALADKLNEELATWNQ